MVRYIPLVLGIGVLLVGMDYLVYRRWRVFALRRALLRWTLPAYALLMVVMPLSFVGYFFYSRWWEVDPKLVRAFLVAGWVVYYTPKLVIAPVLVVAAAVRAVRRFTGKAAGPAEETPAAPGRALSRAEFLRTAGWAAASAPFLLTGYSAFRTLYNFQALRIDVPVPGLPSALEGLTIGQLSDLHAGSLFSERPMHEAVSLLLEMRPDLIAVTGDFVNHEASEMPIIAPALKRLRAELGVFGCLGNHDHYADVEEVIARVGATPVRLLTNAHHALSIGGAALQLVGTDNTGFNQHFADLDRALAGLPPCPPGAGARVLLSHDPTFWDTDVLGKRPDIHLMLCGHTHGGQLGMEWGPLRWSIAQPVYPRWAGLYTEAPAGAASAQHLYVNRGVGTVGPALRIGIRPEVTLLTLRRARA